MKRCLAGILILLAPFQASCFYALTNGCKAAHTLTWQYRIPEALRTLQQENPQNTLAQHFREFALFVRAFATESPADVKEYLAGYDQALDAFSHDQQQNEWSSYARAEAHLHHALILMKDESYLQAAYDVNKAYRLLSDAAVTYPHFLPVQKDLLLLKAGIGSIPDEYQWLARILGFSGNLNQSSADYARLVKTVAADPEYHFYTSEVTLFYAYLQFYLLNDPDGAWQTLLPVTGDYALSPIKAFLRASIALRSNRNEEAAETLKPYADSPPAVPLLDYQYGIALLQQGNKAAGAYMARFIQHCKGHNFIKDAYLRMGWAFLLNNDVANYKNCMTLVKRYGSLIVDEDINAQHEASRKDVPDIHLLEARLFCDGGYFPRAQALLSAIDPAGMSIYNQAEYYYRLGRIADQLNNTNNALSFYNRLMNTPQYLDKSYFVPAACLYSAMIWEKRGNSAKASALFKKVGSFKNYPYKTSFDEKAQSGLKRLGK